jgi:tellurite resistance protein TerC
MTPETFWWIGFVGFLLAILALDLGVVHRKIHKAKPREALLWIGVWVRI